MEIRDPIHGAITLSQEELRLVDNLATQRLRRIKQLGFGEFAFPGATHNRFSHSLGAMHLAGLAFDHIFRHRKFRTEKTRERFRRSVRFAALLHDIGHGPLSHASERAMPDVHSLKIPSFPTQKNQIASHEHYTLKILLDSPIHPLLFAAGVNPLGVASLLSQDIMPNAGEFEDNHQDLRPILSQLVSSELDVDRMDYLLRDSYYAGVTYGRFDLSWLLSNLTFYETEKKLFLAIQQRALHAFEDFLLSRYHMYLMVYFHQLSVIYEELLVRYLEKDMGTFRFPTEMEAYFSFDDYALYTHLAKSKHPLAKRISQNDPYRLLVEEHDPKQADVLAKLETVLQQEKIPHIRSSSAGSLSHYWNPKTDRNPKTPQIFVLDRAGYHPPTPLEHSTKLFIRYASGKVIDRIYVPREEMQKAQSLLEKPVSF